MNDGGAFEADEGPGLVHPGIVTVALFRSSFRSTTAKS